MGADVAVFNFTPDGELLPASWGKCDEANNKGGWEDKADKVLADLRLQILDLRLQKSAILNLKSQIRNYCP
jgi:hypothetical protein